MSSVLPDPHNPRLSGPFVFLDDEQTPASRFYSAPIEIIQAHDPEELEAAFDRLRMAHSDGYYLAGYVSYELGLIFESKLASRLPQSREHPLLCFGVFKNYSKDIPSPLLYTAEPKGLTLTPDWSEADYLSRFKAVQAYLRAGD